ncbi:GNAT family N-acetyltransferase [Spiribacter sp. 1M153]|uniref:GNAT family N-acetyltransferase n=1 Tax=Spiribacter roseus TaxID=1855875 RepID=UPI00349F6D99
MHDLVIEALSSRHDRTGFSSAEPSLDEYLRKRARQDVKRQTSRVFVATTYDNPLVILGYYTLSSLSIALNDLPEDHARRLPRHPIPAALLGRLAVRRDVQGQGVGRLLLADAIKRTLGVSEEIGIYAMIVDAINESAHNFYEQYGFMPLGHSSTRLFLPLKRI